MATLPRLVRVLPRGIQRGTEHKLTFIGERLDDTEEVFFYDQGFQVIGLEVINRKKVEVTVRVAPECRLGEHFVQLRTRTGISDYRILQVEAYPAVAEKESNNSRDEAQLIEPKTYSDEFPEGVGIVVAGVIKDEDHDWFSVDGKKGDRLSIEVVGTRLGDYCDSVLELIGPQGDVVAIVDDTPLTKQDPFVSTALPTDGRYLIHLSDSAGRGRNEAYYRMHVGNFPRPSLASPAIAKVDEASNVVFLGDCLGPIKQELKLKKRDLYLDGVLVSDRLGVTPTPVPFRFSDADVVEEQEPNDVFRKVESTFQIPFAVHGCIEKMSDRDAFAFEAIKGQRIRVEAFGHRIGSAIDTSIRVRRSNSRVLVSNRDAAGTDSLNTFTAPEDGRYTVEVESDSEDYGPMMRYQLEVAVDQPAFSLGVKQFEAYTQQRQQIAVPAGNRFAVVMTAERQGYDGPFELSDLTLPNSIRMIARPMPVGATAMPVVFEAADFSDEERSKESEAKAGQALPLFGELIDLVGHSMTDLDSTSSERVVGSFRNQAQLMRVQPNNMTLKRGVVDQMAVALLEPAPFKIDLVPPVVPISQSGRMKLKLNIHRDEGFEAPITLRLPFRPPGIGAGPTVQLKAKQTTVEYAINANNKAALGMWPICVTATSPNDQGVMISTGLHDLEIVSPFVRIESDLVSGEADSEFVAECALDVLREFEGAATARVKRLPKNVTAKVQTFNANDTSIQFQIKAGKECVVGKNHPASIEVTVKQNGHPIVFDAGRLLVRLAPASKRVKKIVQSETKLVGKRVKETKQ